MRFVCKTVKGKINELLLVQSRFKFSSSVRELKRGNNVELSFLFSHLYKLLHLFLCCPFNIGKIVKGLILNFIQAGPIYLTLHTVPTANMN